MKSRYFLYFVLLLGCAGCTSTAHRERMLRFMNEVDSMNRNYISLAGDSVMPAVTEWMDRHGTSNERMQAHYLLASVYRDRGQAPEALDEFQKAVNCADTTAADCDYRLLSRVHGQMAELFCDQLLPHEMLNELDLSHRFAQMGNDTITWLCAYELKNDAYYLLNQYDSAISILNNVYEEYKRFGYQERAVQSLRNLIFYQTEKGNLSEARRIIKLYEEESGYFNQDTIEKGRELYYFLKANYYLKAAQSDTAGYYIRKLSASICDNDGNMKEAVYKGFYQLYLQLDIRDSICKYASLSYQVNDENYHSASTDELRRMQALYNYDTHRKEAHKKEIEANKNHQLFVIASLLCLIIILCSYISIIRIKDKKNRQIEKLRMVYNHQIEQMEKEKTEIAWMKNNEYQTLLHKKEQEISKIQETINGLQVLIGQKQMLPLESRLAETEEYKRFSYLSNHPLENVQKEDRKKLFEMIDRELPTFYAFLHGSHQLNEDDYMFCVLIRLHFAPKEIRTLTGLQTSNISRKCRYLLKKWYGIDGTPNDFKNIIRTIK